MYIMYIYYYIYIKYYITFFRNILNLEHKQSIILKIQMIFHTHINFMYQFHWKILLKNLVII